MRTTILQNNLPREMVESSSQEIFKMPLESVTDRLIVSPRLPFPYKVCPGDPLRSFPA